MKNSLSGIKGLVGGPFNRIYRTAGVVGNGFDDDFETPGALDPARWTTFNSGATAGVVVAGGQYRNSVLDDAGTGNTSLWFNAAQGRYDYQDPANLTFRIEALGCGPGTVADPTVPLPHIGATNGFQLVGILVHVQTLATVSYRGIFAGHRGAQPFTVENKNTNAGSSSANDEGPNVQTGFADLACIGNGDGTLSFEYKDAGAGVWIAASPPVANNPEPLTVNMRIGLVSYKFDQFKRDFVGVCDSWTVTF